MGSVFSPRYYAAKNRSPSDADPLEFAAFNIAVYGDGVNRWGFSEYRALFVRQAPDTLTIGENRIDVGKTGEIRLDIREVTPKFRKPISGTITLRYDHLYDTAFQLDEAGRHIWHPIAPRSRIAVRLDAPRLQFDGTAYHDMNRGDRPLEADFAHWTWSRHALTESTSVFYDGQRLDGTPFSIAARFDDRGRVSPMQTKPGAVPLPDTLPWRCPRTVRSDSPSRIIRTLENGPFYARSMVRAEILGQVAPAVQETLRLDRFVHPAVQWMLPFRIRSAP